MTVALSSVPSRKQPRKQAHKSVSKSVSKSPPMQTPRQTPRTSEPAVPPAVQVFTDVDMSEPVHLELPGGEAVVYSRRCAGQDQNQDAAGCFVLEAGGVLAVADGMGGQAGGASASRIVIESLAETLEAAAGDSGAVRAAILDAVEESNRRILELGIGAGTTLAAAELLVDTLRPYHVGDSEILVVGQRGLLKLQTISHSPVGYAVEAGMLDGDEAIHHDERHIVSNMVGSSEMRIEVGSALGLAPLDTVLLATDGLCDNLHQPEIIDGIRVKPLVEVARLLAASAVQRMEEPLADQPSKPDDLTFILYRRRR
jgi:serine/threonine protein phosphatase PrpC